MTEPDDSSRLSRVLGLLLLGLTLTGCDASAASKAAALVGTWEVVSSDVPLSEHERYVFEFGDGGHFAFRVHYNGEELSPKGILTRYEVTDDGLLLRSESDSDSYTWYTVRLTVHSKNAIEFEFEEGFTKGIRQMRLARLEPR